MKLPPMTQNQKLVLSFLASTAAGAVSAVIAAVVQSYTQQGLNIPVLINVALIAFGAFFGPALANFVPPHIQQIIQAGADTQAMYRNAAQQSQQTHAALTQTVQTLAQVAQKQAVAAAQPLQGSAQPVVSPNATSGVTQLNFPANANNWMLDKPTASTSAVQPPPAQPVQQLPFPPSALPPVRPVVPQSMPAVKPVDITSQDTTYQSAVLPPDLHFGDSQIMPTVGQ
jgi:hypothetical protein